MPYWFDGNNLIGQYAAASRADSRAQRAFLSALSAYYKAGGGRFLVYFDGDDSSRKMPPAGVAVRYSAPLSTDESILRRLREVRSPSEVIVVTNDRALQTRCRNEGAAALTWQEFVSKMKARPLSRHAESEKAEQVDLEDWIRYFGLDKTSI
jgi:predicted RNA-binding protein with PIN domain